MELFIPLIMYCCHYDNGKQVLKKASDQEAFVFYIYFLNSQITILDYKIIRRQKKYKCLTLKKIYLYPFTSRLKAMKILLSKK